MFLLREDIQAFQQRLRKARSLGDGQLQGFSFQIGEVHGRPAYRAEGGVPSVVHLQRGP